MNKRIKKKRERIRNKELCERYPFLIPRNRWTGKILWEYPRSSWFYVRPYTFTELDAMPTGWRKAFGIQMCEEIKNVLIKGKYLHDYRVVQVKSKWAELRWYDDGAPSSIYHELQDVIDKYTELSRKTCICCGRPATKLSCGWIDPFCTKCAEKYLRSYTDINES